MSCMSPNQDPRARLARAIAETNTAVVARRLNLRRETVLGFIAGASREGTVMLIQSRLPRLDDAPALGLGVTPAPTARP